MLDAGTQQAMLRSVFRQNLLFFFGGGEEERLFLVGLKK